MEDKFNTKTDDFIKWALAAFEHYGSHRYSDALTNMRKCGEAACKLIIYLKYHETAAGQKIAQKSFKELIELLIAEDLVPRKAVNLLEVFQIYGNIATHDNRIAEPHAFYANAALMLFVEWMFTECLRILVPSRLKKFLSLPQHEKMVTEEAKKELTHRNKEIELLKKEVELQVEKLQNKQQESIQYKLRASQAELENAELKKLLNRHIIEKKESRKESQTVVIPEHIHPKKSKKVSKKSFTGIMELLVISAIVTFYFFYQGGDPPPETKLSKTNNDSVFTVLLLPFSVMQDNPNINFKLEELILRKATEKFKLKKRAITILYLPEQLKPAQTLEQAREAANNNNASLVIYGDIYEQTITDSIRAIVKYLFINRAEKAQTTSSGEASNKSFATLTDAQVDSMQTQVETVIELLYANSIFFKKEYYRTLALISEIAPHDKDAKLNYYELKINCYFRLSEYQKAKQQAENLLALDSSNASAYQYMAKTFVALGNYDSAGFFYEKSISLDTIGITDFLLNYSDLLCSSYFQQYEKAKKLTMKAMSKDSAKVVPWYYLAEIEVYLKDFNLAKKYFEKALELDSNYNSARIGFAKLLAFSLKDPKAALLLLEPALKKDSTNYALHYTMGDVYSALKNPSLSEYHFQKSKEYSPQESAGAYLGMTIAACEKNDIATAKNYALLAYNLDSTQANSCAYLGACYYGLDKLDSALHFLTKAYRIDSFNEVANFHLGKLCITSNLQYRNLKKSSEYFEKALQTDPDWISAMQYLGLIYFSMEEFDKAKKTFLRIYNLQPNNSSALENLASTYQELADYKTAKIFFEKAISISPNNDAIHTRLSVTLFRLQEYQSSLLHSQKAVEINPQNADNHFRLAEIYIALSNFHKAKEHYQTAIDIDPKLKSQDMEKWLP